MSSTHACLNVDEILRHLACELVASGGKGAAVALACCCKNFEDPVLDALWETQDQLRPLLKSFPADVWNDEGSVSASPTFDPLSTKIFDLIVFQKNSHSNGMGPLPDIRSKNSGAPRGSLSRLPTPGRSLGVTTSHPQQTLASRSEDLHMS